MPATAGRVRMPANNRVHSSAALQTHGIWQSAIGYDPYAPDQKQPPPAADRDAQASLSAPTADQQNTYDSFQGLLALARLTGSNADEARGACRKCGRVGHLPFQCRNFLKDELAAVATAAAAGLNISSHLEGGNGSSHRKERSRDKGSRKGHASSDSSSEEDELSDTGDSGLSDSSADSEMERAITAKFGKDILKSLCKKSKSSHSKDRSSHKRSHSKRSKSKKEDESDGRHKRKGKHSSGSKRSRSSVSDSESDESSEEERRKKRRHSYKHGSSRSKHHSKHSENASERKRGSHSKKSKSSHNLRRDSESD